MHLEHPPRNNFCPKPVPRCHHPYIFNHILHTPLEASQVAQWERIHLPMQEMQVRSLGWQITWSGKWQPTPVFLPGKFHGQKSLAGYSPWDCKKLDLTEHTHACTSFYLRLKWWGEWRTKITKWWERFSRNWDLIGWWDGLIFPPLEILEAYPLLPSLVLELVPVILSTAVARGQAGNLMREGGRAGRPDWVAGTAKERICVSPKDVTSQKQTNVANGALQA